MDEKTGELDITPPSEAITETLDLATPSPERTRESFEDLRAFETQERLEQPREAYDKIDPVERRDEIFKGSTQMAPPKPMLHKPRLSRPTRGAPVKFRDLGGPVAAHRVFTPRKNPPIEQMFTTTSVQLDQRAQLRTRSRRGRFRGKVGLSPPRRSSKGKK